MRQIGRLFLATGLLTAMMSLAPAAQAATNEDVIAQNNASKMASQAYMNAVNDYVRCVLAAQGQKLPGTVTFSSSTPATLVNACTPPAGMNAATPTITTPSASTADCVLNSRALTKFEGDLVNDFEISVIKAAKNNLPMPAMSDDVKALIGGC